MIKLIFRRALFFVKTFILFLIFWLLSTSVYENMNINRQINEFVERGFTQGQKVIETERLRVFNVPRETSNETISYYKNGKRRAYHGIMGEGSRSFTPGVKGDIILTLESPFPTIPIVNNFMRFFTGGHAALVGANWNSHNINITENDNIDIAGMEKDPNLDIVGIIRGTNWRVAHFERSFIGVRVVSTEKQRSIAVNHALSFLGDRYNHTFIFNTYDRHYCTDKISKAFAAADINLNHDGFATTAHDILVSSNTYIFMYRFVRNNVEYVFMICDYLKYYYGNE